MVLRHLKSFRALALATGLLFTYLFLSLLLDPVTFIKDFGLEPSLASVVLGRRASMFMLGIAVQMFGVQSLPASPARQALGLATGVSMLGLAVLGTYEYRRGTVNSTVLVAAVIETVLGLLFLLVAYMDRRARITQRQSEMAEFTC